MGADLRFDQFLVAFERGEGFELPSPIRMRFSEDVTFRMGRGGYPGYETARSESAEDIFPGTVLTHDVPQPDEHARDLGRAPDKTCRA